MADLTLKARVEKIEYWRNGNGTKGAAATISDHEERISCLEIHQGKEEITINRAIKRALKEHEKSASGIIKTLAPYAALISWVAINIAKGLK